MTEISTVCVYCGSSSNVDDIYKQSAIDLGKIMAKEGWDIVYGGGRVGLMGLIADSALEAGTKVIGIIPSHIQKREVEHTSLTELHIVENMHTRKQMMVERSDAFVILAGGLGTLDELFELLTWKQLGLHDKPVVIVNTKDYWADLFNAVKNIANSGFMREEDMGLFSVVERIEQVPEALKNAPKERFDPATKWI